MDVPQARVPAADELRQRIDAALDHTYLNRTLNVQDNAAWQILHGILAFGTHYEIRHDGEMHNAIEWLLEDRPLAGWTVRPGTRHLETLLAGEEPEADDESGSQGLVMVLEAGSRTGQGHYDQWLSKLAQSDLPSDTTLMVGGREYQIADIVQQAMWDVYEGKECSWTLTSLSTYIPIDSQWYASDGQLWDIERLIAMEAAQDLNTSPCGGTHRLFGISKALEAYRHSLGDAEVPLTGGWLAAHEKIQQAIRTVREYQNPDGSFSTNYFARPARAADLSLQINTTGHTLEFLAQAMTPEELEQPWVKKAALRLCDLFDQTRNIPLESGSLYHAANGLRIYRSKRWGAYPYPQRESAAESEPSESN